MEKIQPKNIDYGKKQKQWKNVVIVKKGILEKNIVEKY